MSIQDTLQERGNRYGDFTDHAKIAQDLQDVMRRSETTSAGGATLNGWTNLSAVQKQALTVLADKVARILSGDPNYADNWHDIQGYAKLVEERLPVPAEAVPANDNDKPVAIKCDHTMCGGYGFRHTGGCPFNG